MSSAGGLHQNPQLKSKVGRSTSKTTKRLNNNGMEEQLQNREMFFSEEVGGVIAERFWKQKRRRSYGPKRDFQFFGLDKWRYRDTEEREGEEVVTIGLLLIERPEEACENGLNQRDFWFDGYALGKVINPRHYRCLFDLK